MTSHMTHTVSHMTHTVSHMTHTDRPPVSECPPDVGHAPVLVPSLLQQLHPHVRDGHGHAVVKPHTSFRHRSSREGGREAGREARREGGKERERDRQVGRERGRGESREGGGREGEKERIFTHQNMCKTLLSIVINQYTYASIAWRANAKRNIQGKITIVNNNVKNQL